MIRLFLPPEQLTMDQAVITGDNARHLSLVLKISPGEAIAIFDGQGYKYECIVQTVHKKEVTVRLNEKKPYSVESPLSITLAQGIPKGDRMDMVVQKATELGVNKIIPVITERAQVRHTHKIERWRKIALSASQQSGRDKIPGVEEPVSLDDFLARQLTQSARGYIEDIKGVKLENVISIIFSEESRTRNLKQVLSHLNEVKGAILLVGPEGGFSKEEVSASVEKGFTEVSLGSRILRTETVPLAALSIIQYELGDMGQTSTPDPKA
jgi:16S rRNA (uracil1498-N3)-methyltransferase